MHTVFSLFLSPVSIFLYLYSTDTLDLKCMNFSLIRHLDWMDTKLLQAVLSSNQQFVNSNSPSSPRLCLGNNSGWKCLCLRWRALPSPSGTIKPTFWNSRAVWIRTTKIEKICLLLSRWGWGVGDQSSCCSLGLNYCLYLSWRLQFSVLFNSRWASVFVFVLLSICLISCDCLQRAEPRHHHSGGGRGGDHHSGLHGVRLHHREKVRSRGPHWLSAPVSLRLSISLSVTHRPPRLWSCHTRTHTCTNHLVACCANGLWCTINPHPLIHHLNPHKKSLSCFR